MALSNLSTITDIEEYLKQIILSVRPDVNLQPKTPLYDILVRAQAEIVYNERRNLDDVYRILRVLPLFNSDGSLKYPDMEEELLDRFMMAIDPITRATIPVRLFFDRKCDFEIQNGSYLSYLNITLEVVPAFVPENSDLWLQEADGWSYPIEIFSDTVVEEQSIPVSSDWSLGALRVRSTVGQVFKAVNRVVVNTTSTPALTLSTLKNSIANRSYSNARSLRNKFQSESAFRPNELKKNYIMRFSDVFFIDGYRVIGEDPMERGGVPVVDRKRVIAKVSGMGKVLLDYGVDLYRAPITLEHVPYGVDPKFAHTNPEVRGDIYQQLEQVILGGLIMGSAPGSNTDPVNPGALYATITKYDEYDIPSALWTRKIQIEFFKNILCTAPYKVAETAKVDISDAASGYAAVNPYSGSGVYGGVYFTYSEPVTTAAPIEIRCLNVAVYRARVPSTLGILSPAAVVCMNDAAVMETYIAAQAGQLASKEVDKIFSSQSTPAVVFENSGFRIVNDTEKQISVVKLEPKGPTDKNPFTPYDTLNNQLYWRLTNDSGVRTFRISLDPDFADPTMIVAQGTAAAGLLAGTEMLLTPMNNYKAQFRVAFTKDEGSLITEPSTGTRLLPDAEITAFANEYLYFATRINTGAANQFHGKTAQMVYYGTNPEYLGDAQALLGSRTWVEIGNTLKVAAFRPVSLTMYYDPDYVYPFIEARTPAQLADPAYMQRVADAKAKFTLLQDALARYLSDYTGDVRQLDLSAISRSLYDQTGLFVKRLDYTLATQRGYLIRGHIDIGLDATAYFNFDEVIDILEQDVDYTAPKVDVTQTIDTRESAITVPPIYRYVFSKVRL